MQNSVVISSIKYEEIRKESIFFVKIHLEYTFDKDGNEIDKSEWYSIDRDLEIRFSAGYFGKRELGYCLCVIEKASPALDYNNKIIPDRVKLYFHDASPAIENDFYIILSNCIDRSRDINDKYASVSLLWFLDKNYITFEYFNNVLRRYDTSDLPFIFNILRGIYRCLSFNKQNVIKKLFELHGDLYDVYLPTALTDAIFALNVKDYNNLNLFQIFDIVIGVNTINSSFKKKELYNNIFYCFICWMDSENALSDYSILKDIFPMVAEPIRLAIVRRYFHDIRLGNTTLDCQLLNQFKDNQYDDFIRYRYSIETPCDQINLTVPLLIDSILTLYNSKGLAFQTFDGVLDFAMTHCDKAHPLINFGLDRFLPTCNNSAVYNESFKGFIDYQLIRKINQDKMSDDNLIAFIRTTLDTYGERQQFAVCNGNIISEEQSKKCSNLYYLKKEHKVVKCESCTNHYYEDKWLVKGHYKKILNTFLSLDISEGEQDIPIDLSMISPDVLRTYIKSIISKYENIDADEFLVPSHNRISYNINLIESVSDILRMRIFPQQKAIVGIKFDVFGYWNELSKKLTPEQLLNKQSQEYKVVYDIYLKKEAEEVKKRTIESLKKELNKAECNGAFFELTYDANILNMVINKYYFKGSLTEQDKPEQHEFLTLSYVGNFKPFCAPELCKANNPAINLPYFWCRGKECFHNNLENQTLEYNLDWHNYSLYHLIEIVGYQKLYKTYAGYEPDSVVRNYIAIVNKAMQKFKRLKCHSCGHLLFTHKGIGYNRYNYYSCQNHTCHEFMKPVYLSYCYKCKKGLIDSRDTKRCPNGWYICPTCLSCCDDAQYERQAQRYIVSNRPVPERIKSKLGCGHNNKGKYYCPDCGAPIEMIKDELGNSYYMCTNCHKRYNLNILNQR